MDSYIGMCKAEYELCLDCRWPAAEKLFRYQCPIRRHKPTVVVYRDEEAKELVTVRYPENLSGMLDRKCDYHVRHNAAECSRGKRCSFPHTQAEARIWNQYKLAVGPHSTAHPPTQVRRCTVVCIFMVLTFVPNQWVFIHCCIVLFPCLVKCITATVPKKIAKSCS